MENQFYDDIYKFIFENMCRRNFDKTSFFDFLLGSDNLTLIDILTFITPNRDIQKKFLADIESIRPKIINLYRKHSIPIIEQLDTRTLLLSLFKECANIRSFCLSSYHKLKIKDSTIKTTFGRNLHSRKLHSLLEQYHKIILWGDHGSGKTRFIKYCLRIWNKTDYCIVDYSNSLSNTLNEVKYIDYQDYEQLLSLSALDKHNFLTSLLIIDNMCFSSDAAKDIEDLKKSNANIIVITTTPIDTDTFYSYELPSLSDNDLISIFETESNIKCDISNCEQLLTQTWRNPLFISLIAKQCGKENAGINTLENILKYLNQPDDKSFKFQNIKHPNNISPVNFMGHIKYVYKNVLKQSKLQSDNTKQLKYLCCFGCNPIPLSFISSVFPDYNNKQFDTLSQTGLIERSSETVQIPPLIFYAVWTAENFIPDQEDLKDLCIGLRNFLMCYDDTLSVPYLSSLLLIFAQNLYNNVSITHNPKQNKASGYFETWQDLLSLIFTYYNQNGDFQLAEETHALIHYPDNVQNRHTPLDKDLFHLANNISLYPKSDADNIIKEIDNICLSPKINDAFSADITNVLIDALDKAIKDYCNLFFSYIMEPNSSVEKEQRHYTNILGMLLSQLFDPTVSRTMNKFFQNFYVNLEERFKYYKGCHTLMTMPIILPEYLQKHCLELKTWKNTNYRIRSIAFFVFMHNFSLFKNANTNLGLINFNLLLQFNPTIMPEISYLTEQIDECKLIPHETFYICLCCYVSTALVQYTFFPNEAGNFSFSFYKNCLKELIRRIVLYEDNLDTIMTRIDNIFTLIKQKRDD